MDENDVNKLSELALQLHEKGEYANAEKVFLQALYLMDDKNNQLYQKLVYGLGINYVMQENYEGAESCFQEGRLNAQKANNMDQELAMLHELVKLSRAMNDTEAAEMLVNEEILYREKHAATDAAGLSVAHYEKALVYLDCKQPIKSEEPLKKALEYARKSQEKESVAYLLLRIGDYYFSLERWEEARQYYFESLQGFEESKDKKNVEILTRKIDSIKGK